MTRKQLFSLLWGIDDDVDIIFRDVEGKDYYTLCAGKEDDEEDFIIVGEVING